MVNSHQISARLPPPPRQAAPVDRSSFGLPPSSRGVLPKSISASDVGQTFLSAGSGDFPVPRFRVKLSALVREVGKLRNRQARKPALPFGQHAPRLWRAGNAKGKKFPGSNSGFIFIQPLAFRLQPFINTLRASAVCGATPPKTNCPPDALAGPCPGCGESLLRRRRQARRQTGRPRSKSSPVVN